MYICPSCQTENRETAKFCRRCGQSRTQSHERSAVALSERGTDDSVPAAAEESGIEPTGALPLADDEFAEEITEEEVRQELTQRTTAPPPAVKEPGEEPVPETGGEAAAARRGPTCPSCAANVRATDKFCIWCGEKQPQRLPPETKKCPECRAQLPVKANFCFLCGTNVSAQPKAGVRAPAEIFKEDDPDLLPRFEA